MARLVWSPEATGILLTLPAPVRADIDAKTQYLYDFPDMYPVRRRGRFRGQRFLVAFDWLVYYIVMPEQVTITTIGHARRRGA
ncbi:MAG: type II toxin-antitoxin system RelE/ParE family toxin [Armatimonadota bacterium]